MEAGLRSLLFWGSLAFPPRRYKPPLVQGSADLNGMRS
jgi:hypothetical protein